MYKKPSSIVLIHPPVAKPCEPPAGIARIAGAISSKRLKVTCIDANIEGLDYILDQIIPPKDTWSHRAHQNLKTHLKNLRATAIYANQDQYRRAIADINRLLSFAGDSSEIRVSLADYRDERLSPVSSADLLKAAENPERTPYFSYYENKLLPQLDQLRPHIIGISINFLSQALCAFALIGLIKKKFPRPKIIVGGGLITSFMKQPGQDLFCKQIFHKLVDQLVCGPGEHILLDAVGLCTTKKFFIPDYSSLLKNPYLSPGPILPFSASDGCWWRRCAFCPERAEKRPFHPIPFKVAILHLKTLIAQSSPVLVHLLDNAVSPALLKALVASPLNVPWYGFVRIGPPLDDLSFCYQLAASGCVMLKIGLESGSQHVLNQLEKGVSLDIAERVLENLKKAGIATYVYLLFGTPAEERIFAEETLNFVAAHHASINFLNLAIFNLPINGPETDHLDLKSFYEGDLALYQDFIHPLGWHRKAIRQFLAKTFKKHPLIQSIIRRDPPTFTSNHAPFFCSENLLNT